MIFDERAIAALAADLFNKSVEAYQVAYNTIANNEAKDLAERIATAKPSADQAAATLIKARVSALMAERDAEIARLREALDEAVDVFAGMCDDEIEEELLPRLRQALGATHEQG